MMGQREEIKRWLEDAIQKFRQKGALTPEAAKTATELGLSPRFEEVMRRRLGKLGIFVEINGRYYLSEERLRQVESMHRKSGGADTPRSSWTMRNFRLVRLLTSLLIVALLLVNIYIQSWELRIATLIIVVGWIALTLYQIYKLSRKRRKYTPIQ